MTLDDDQASTEVSASLTDLSNSLTREYDLIALSEWRYEFASRPGYQSIQ